MYSSKRKILSSIESGSTHYVCLQFNPKEEHKSIVSLSVKFIILRDLLIIQSYFGIGTNANLLQVLKLIHLLLTFTK